MEKNPLSYPGTPAEGPSSVERIEFKCRGCGGLLEYAPGTKKLVCPHCGAENAISGKREPVEEMDFDRFIAEHYASERKVEVVTVKCTFCGASVTLRPNVTSDRCPYCAADLILKNGTTSLLLKPSGVVPFCIDLGKAQGFFRDWIAGRWFAPSDLKRRATTGSLDGVYIPYWTYDAIADTEYTGRRGTYYYVSETYTEMENGRPVSRVRQVRHTQWNPASGAVRNSFDDILVPACRSLPDKYLYAMDSWNPKAVVPFAEEYLSGFRAQSYEVDLKDGLVIAKKLMEPEILETIRRDIGGDEQEVLATRSSYSDLRFKHILLPLWISSYRYGGKVYRFLVNGQTGEIQGERPYSAIKIAFAALGILIAIIIFLMLMKK